MRERYIPPKELYTGRELEYDLFGHFDVNNPKYRKRYEELLSGRPITDEKNRPAYLPYRQAMELVREFTDDPHQPKKDFLRDLRLAVADELGTKEEDVLVYTATGTPLDWWHGTDAFLAVRSKRGEAVVRLDASLRKEKELKADLQIKEVPDAVQEENAYLEAVDDYARKVSQIVLRKEEELRPEAAE